ncbi:hypothetical protein [Rhizobium sp. BK176]|uniref:hypothetical protein n=1 Tax=Rhizobium sp. BK176 TaxID=2587071 RepID=UPI0021671ACB|nr:hypothetical protein [Rhizobium sp. BK176]MCS4088855.1 hypothetical protein [Rhizobium sp. BK176]
MQITFELAHRNSAVKTRSSMGERYLTLSEPVTLDIAEVADMEAPIAVTWNTHEGPAHTRWYDGRHFRAVRRGDNAAELLAGLPPVDGRRPYRPDEGFTRGFLTYSEGNEYRLTDPRLEHYDQASRRRALANAAEWARNCLVVDGKMYMACAEPRYNVSSWGMDVETNWPADPGTLSNDHRPNTINHSPWFHTERFCLDDVDEALSMAKTWFDRDMIEPADVVVHIPSSIGTDHSRAILREAAQFMLDALNKHPLDTIPPAILRGILPVSELLWQRDWTDVDYDLLAEAVDAARSAAQRGDPAMDIYGRDDRQRLDEALRRWFDSEITLDVSHKELPKP